MPINLTVQIAKIRPQAQIPEYKTEEAAGFDLVATESIVLHAKQRGVVGTGLRMAIPRGWQLEIRPRSGMSLNHGLTVLNAPGTVDSDYRGEIKVILYNADNKTHEINAGDRIAQGVITKAYQVEFSIKGETELSETGRGEGGFGHTGK